MTLTANNVAASAAQQKDILERLARTDYAKSAVKQSNAYLDDLEVQRLALSKRVRMLEAKTSQEHKDHKKYNESTIKRFTYRASGQKEKFESKAAREEKEYFEALQEERSAKDQLEVIKTAISEAQDAKSSQESDLQEHERAQAELDELYNSLFGGPTPEIPEEDQKEWALRQAQEAYFSNQSLLDAETQVVKLLTQASGLGCMNTALNALDEAGQMSTLDMFGGGTMVDSLERNALCQAQIATGRVEMLVMQARHISPQVGEIGPMRIASGHMMSDVVFDNIFTDYSFHNKIEQSQVEVKQAAAQLAVQLNAAKQREQELTGKSHELRKPLEQARVELQNFRTEAFQQLALEGN